MKLSILIIIVLILICIDLYFIYHTNDNIAILSFISKLLMYGFLIYNFNSEKIGRFFNRSKIYVLDTFNDVNESLSKLFNILDDYDMCFIGGALVIEDPENKIFNLLTYDISEVDTNHKLKLSNYTNMIQTLTHSSFSDRFKPSGITPNNPSFIIPKQKCITDKFKCNKFERKIYIENICKNCVTDNSYVEIKQNLLYYPFADLDGKNYLYIKLESYPSISLGHAKAAIDTYVTKSKFNSDSKTCKPRRESAKDLESWKNEFKNKDLEFYNKLVSKDMLDDNELKIKIEHYNRNIRSGNELFIPYSFIQKNKIFKDLA